HLELRRMDVHVDLARRDAEEEDGDRIAAAKKEGLVAVQHGAQQEAVADRASGAVADRDVGPDEPGAADRLPRWGEKPAERVPARGRFDRHEVAGTRPPVNLRQALPRLTHRGKGEHLPPVVLETEADRRA